MIEATARRALAAAAAIGDYFVVETESLADPGWRRFTDLLDDPRVVNEQVGLARSTLSERTGITPIDVDLRACASIHFLGLASRLIAPPLATLTLAGLVVACGPHDLRWQSVDGGPVPIGYLEASVHYVEDCGTAADVLHEVFLEPVVQPLVEAFGSVSPIVLWGNVASALVGAAGMIVRSGTTFMLDPIQISRAALTRGPLAGTGSFDVADRFFRRASCCLFYRIPGGGTCGDCVLR